MTSDTYQIKYTYKNAFDAITFKTRDITLFASPVAQFTSSNNCIASDVLFTDQSQLVASPFPTTMQSYLWTFGDGETSVDQNPAHRYDESDEYFVTLKVTTAQGCSNITAPLANELRVGDVPEAAFDWASICNNDFTEFKDLSDPGDISVITDYVWDFGDGNILSGPKNGVIPPGTHHPDSTRNLFDMPHHKYAANGTYSVKLTVFTNDGCSADSTREVFILPSPPTITPDASVSYFRDFETDDGGWIPEAFEAKNSTALNPIKSDTSWIWGIPTGLHINSGSNSQRAWWTGKNPDPESSYFANENSMVNGPCFDLSLLNRPMISIDYFADSDIADGAVLEYSINGGNDWETVGVAAIGGSRPGINWYNAIGLFSSPGDQTIGYGWTGTAATHAGEEGKWKTARYNLDMIPVAERDQVRLRIAFASNDGNPTAGPYNGFAFDNVFVGEKKRTVLVEHFTNTSSTTSIDANEHFDDLYDNQSSVRDADFFKIQYHMGVPGADPLNQQNPSDPGARALWYDISLPPYAIMDGIRGNYFTKVFNGAYNKIDAEEVDRRALQDPAFLVTALTFEPTAAQDVLSGTVDFEYIDPNNSHSEPVLFQVLLLETDVMVGSDLQRNVVRKLMLQRDGLQVHRPWQNGDTWSIVFDYTIDVPIDDPTKLYVAAFVQDKNTKEILQAAVFKAPTKVGVPPVGVVDNPATAEVRDISVYPNPASRYVNFYLENPLTNNYNWEIVDQRGITVLDGALNHDLSTPQQVEIRDLANGIYFVRIMLTDKTMVYRKIAILNSH